MRLKMTVNGTEYVVDVEAEQEVRAVPAPIVIGGGPGSAPTPTTASVPGAAANAITAPLAGSVARILVKEGDKVEAGQTIYRAGNMASGVTACVACHGPNGGGNPMARFPGLSGQHADYTALQLKNFRSGVRANDAGSMMRGIAKKMTDAEIEAVAQYIQGLH